MIKNLFILVATAIISYYKTLFPQPFNHSHFYRKLSHLYRKYCMSSLLSMARPLHLIRLLFFRP